MAGEEEFVLGECRYAVLVIRHMVKEDGQSVDAQTALYSPELEVVLAKRYDEGTQKEQTIGYKSIHPLFLR